MCIRDSINAEYGELLMFRLPFSPGLFGSFQNSSLSFTPSDCWKVNKASFSIQELSADKPSLVGRRWHAAELREKSFDELHELWYILLKERSRLQSGLLARKSRLRLHQLWKVRKSMTSIKVVLGEREKITKRLHEEQRRHYFEQLEKSALEDLRLSKRDLVAKLLALQPNTQQEPSSTEPSPLRQPPIRIEDLPDDHPLKL
eukprot:TRINITY_DN3196_c0_g1_i2.p1 TRINITY_DN3196_c0_g1~~TRINITY_DN3196_c0_g1_i2.p1  ORF type:complete len:209 (-),score=57.87 TRINITY_DN3196_c0_g1_i2:124-729(-)